MAGGRLEGRACAAAGPAERPERGPRPGLQRNPSPPPGRAAPAQEAAKAGGAGKTHWEEAKEVLMLAIPTVFDLIATVLMNVGLLRRVAVGEGSKSEAWWVGGRQRGAGVRGRGRGGCLSASAAGRPAGRGGRAGLEKEVSVALPSSKE